MQIVESNGSSGYMFCIVLLTESGGRQIAESCLLSNSVVEDLDVFRDLARSLLAGGEAAVMHQFGFKEPQQLSIGALSQQFPLRLMEGCMPNWRSSCWSACEQYWLPRSEWRISPLLGRLVATARNSACMTNCCVIRASRA